MNKIPNFLCIAVLAGVSAGALAAESGDTEVAALDEIVVTAQKREQNLQTVGTSITAFDGAALQKLGISDVTAIANQTPGMQFNQYGATVTVYNLRGVSQNDFSDHEEAPIAVYADDAYIASMGALAGSLFDIQRVEVLRGPQGTSVRPQRNRRPDPLHQRKAEFRRGRLRHRDFRQLRAESKSRGPSIRPSTTSWRSAPPSPPPITMATSPTPSAMRSTMRIKSPDAIQILYKPSERREILLKIHGLNNDNETAGLYSWAASHPDATGRGVFIARPAPPTAPMSAPKATFSDARPEATSAATSTAAEVPIIQSEDRRGIFNRTVFGSTLHVTWNFDAFTLTSVTDYLSLQKRYGEDSDISPNPLFNYDTFQHYHQLAEELRLNGTAGALKWIAGVYFLDYHTHNDEVVDLAPVFGGETGAPFTLTTQSQSAFGQLEYDFSPNWTAIAGLALYERSEDL